MDKVEREGKVSAVIPHPNTLPEYTRKKGMNILPSRILLVCENEQTPLSLQVLSGRS